MADFHVGQQVVCVDASPDWRGRPTNVVKNAVYTIAEIGEPDSTGALGLILVEVRPQYRGRPGYRASRFRPVRKTSIEIFERMLTKAPESVS